MAIATHAESNARDRILESAYELFARRGIRAVGIDEVIARAYPDAYEGLTARTYGPPGLEEDIRFCARENVLEVVPRFARMVGPAAEIVPS